jgi:hypothetical protein
MKKFIYLALLSLVAADDTVVTHAENLKCGKCIKGGFNFCFEGSDGDVVASGASAPAQKCCADDQCAENTNAAYICSSTYADKEYALQMCPQPQARCGVK